MATERKKLTRRILTAVLMSLMPISTMVIPLVSNQPAQASYVAKWFDGNWSCKIGDRTAKMTWRMAYDEPNSKYIGKYTENGSSWTSISEISSNYNTLNMRFDRTKATWNLTYYSNRRTAEGATTIQGQKRPISCTKISVLDEPIQPTDDRPPAILNPEGEEPKSVNPCKRGYVLRAATATDRVCVTPQVRAQTRSENAAAASRREPNGGPYGPDTCKQGYVWREATPDDHVCVTPQVRSQAAEDNQRSTERRVPKG
jgi:hypothetical protein